MNFWETAYYRWKYFGNPKPENPYPANIHSLVGLYFSHTSSRYSLPFPWLEAREPQGICGETAEQVESNQEVTTRRLFPIFQDQASRRSRPRL